MPLLSRFEKPSPMPIGISNPAIDNNIEINENDKDLVPLGSS
jgi:hypothetical protein